MFRKDCRNVAAVPDEIGETPLARTLFSEPAVLYRTDDGAVAAREDRRCHRHLPPSLGKVAGDGLRCGYRGLVYDADGVCIRVPVRTAGPPSASCRCAPGGWNRRPGRLSRRGVTSWSVEHRILGCTVVPVGHVRNCRQSRFP